jgi:hypothetical protein
MSEPRAAQAVTDSSRAAPRRGGRRALAEPRGARAAAARSSTRCQFVGRRVGEARAGPVKGEAIRLGPGFARRRPSGVSAWPPGGESLRRHPGFARRAFGASAGGRRWS